MSRTFVAGLVVLVLLSPRCFADEPAMELEQAGSYGGGLAWSMTCGWEFNVNQPVTVIQLGVMDHDRKGLDADFPVGIWNPAGELVVTSIVPAGKGGRLDGEFRYVEIEPVSLKTGRQYVIGALYTPSTKEVTISSNGGVRFTTTSEISWSRSRRDRTDGLALPRRTDSHYDECPGCFGPNFIVKTDESAKSRTRTYYTTREVQVESRFQTVAVPVKADGSHRDIHPPQVSLFATADGNLTQVVIDGKPLGIGSAAFEKLASESLRLAEESHQVNSSGDHVMEIPQIFYTPHVRASDLQTAMRVAFSYYYTKDGWPRSGRGCEVFSLSDGRLKQLQHEGKFVDPERFRDAGEYIEDRWTGLLWQKDGGVSGQKTYEGAADYAKNIELSGIKGWRVPTRDEFCTIFPATFAPFTGTKYNPSSELSNGPDRFPHYWTSDLDLRVGNNFAWIYQWYGNGGGNNCNTSNSGYVRCVRNRHDP